MFTLANELVLDEIGSAYEYIPEYIPEEQHDDYFCSKLLKYKNEI